MADLLTVINRNIKAAKKMLITSKDNKLKKQISGEISRLVGIRKAVRRGRRKKK